MAHDEAHRSISDRGGNGNKIKIKFDFLKENIIYGKENLAVNIIL